MIITLKDTDGNNSYIVADKIAEFHYSPPRYDGGRDYTIVRLAGCEPETYPGNQIATILRAFGFCEEPLDI